MPQHRTHQQPLTWAGMLMTLGIVFGDIGTSPLYVFKAIAGATGPISEIVVLGGLSCIFWTLTILTSFKYIFLALEADNRGEGGILALMALRIGWGFLGSEHARFSDFVRSPRATLDYARGLLTDKAPRFLGHNPLAGMMVIALMIALAATGASGWQMTTEAYRSARWLEEAHEALATVTLALAAIHILAVFIMSVWHGENLVRAMVTGRKRR